VIFVSGKHDKCHFYCYLHIIYHIYIYVTYIYLSWVILMCGHCSDPSESCRCRGRRVPGFLQPRLLLKLAQKPSHGYELMDLLSQQEEVTPDPGNLYRILRNLEDEGLVQSSWDTDNPGPARRVYQITRQGLDYLHILALEVKDTSRRLESFLSEYEVNFSKNRSKQNVRT
jgi:PadR family transcriptional regulator, regulatory protein PadR